MFEKYSIFNLRLKYVLAIDTSDILIEKGLSIYGVPYTFRSSGLKRYTVSQNKFNIIKKL